MTVSRAVPKQITVLIDTREKIPLLFPKTIPWHLSTRDSRYINVKTERKCLKTADYYLKNHSATCMIERKGSIAELHQNTTVDRGRCRRALDRLAQATAHPYVLLDGTAATFLRPSPHVAVPQRALQFFLEDCVSREIAILWLGGGSTRPARIKVGTALLQILLSHIFHLTVPKPSSILPSVAKMATSKKKGSLING